MSIAQLSKCLKRQKLKSFRIGVDIMSNRLFQGVIHQMRDAVDRTIGVIDETGTIISCSELGKIGEVISNASQIFAEDGDRIVNGCTYRSFGSHMQAEYAVFIDGEDELAGKYADICCVALSNIKQCYDEKFDRATSSRTSFLTTYFQAISLSRRANSASTATQSAPSF